MKSLCLCAGYAGAQHSAASLRRGVSSRRTATYALWAYRSSHDSEEPIVLLDYQPGRGQVHPQTFLGDYRGMLVTSDYAPWRTLHGATYVGCMAHSRRRFVEVLKTRKDGGGPPEQALRFCEQLGMRPVCPLRYRMGRPPCYNFERRRCRLHYIPNATVTRKLVKISQPGSCLAAGLMRRF
jgi:hypothetical protein